MIADCWFDTTERERDKVSRNQEPLIYFLMTINRDNKEDISILKWDHLAPLVVTP